MIKKELNIRKDDFKRFKKCPKLMWIFRNRLKYDVKNWCLENILFLDKEELKKFKSNFNFDKKNRKKVDSELEIRIINGILFEKTVKEYFSNEFSIFDFEKIDRKKQSLKDLKKILNDKQYDVFYHPLFKYKNYVTECDILKRNGDGFDILEVKGKGKSGITTDKKDLKNDLLYQKWLLVKLGINIKNCFIVHLNSEYILNKKLDLKKLININDAFNDSTLNIDIEQDLLDINRWLNFDWKNIKLRILNNAFCEEKKYDFCTFLIPKIKSTYNITHLHRLNRIKKAEILSIENPKNIDLYNFDFEKYNFIKPKHIRQINVVRNIDPIINDLKIVKEILKEYKYPIYFYDFETCPFAIPVFDNSNPYQQIPFQFSIHVLLNENYNLKTFEYIKHYEFIVKNKNNPILEFVDEFIKKMSLHGKGTYVAYGVQFEKTIIKKILKNNINNNVFNKKQIKKLEEIENESIDLMFFFKNDFNIYLKKFKGSFSIKSTLPSLDPSFTYKNLNIKSGDQALSNYYNYKNNLISDEVWNNKISIDLRKYCGLDSLAMVIIFKKIIELIEKYK